MSLTQQDIDFIKANMAVWLAEQSLGKPPAVYEIELRERMVRVEEELKHHRELMRQGFEQMDKRFEAMQAIMDKRFEQVERDASSRSTSVSSEIDKRFDEMIRRHDRHFLWLIAVHHDGRRPGHCRRQVVVARSAPSALAASDLRPFGRTKTRAIRRGHDLARSKRPAQPRFSIELLTRVIP